MKFAELAIGKIPHNTESRSKKLDSVCITGCWVGRTGVGRACLANGERHDPGQA